LRFNVCREVWDYLVDFLRPHPRYFVFTWSDPLPAVADLVTVLVKGASHLVRSMGHIVTRGLLSGGRSRAAPGSRLNLGDVQRYGSGILALRKPRSTLRKEPREALPEKGLAGGDKAPEHVSIAILLMLCYQTQQDGRNERQ